MTDQARSIELVHLDGTAAIELESDYSRSFLLREKDAAGLDLGAKDFHLFDPNNQNDDIGGGAGTGPNPNGGGYAIELRDTPGGTLLATGTVTQNGVRAVQRLGHNVSAAATNAVRIIYPDMSNPAVAPTIVTREYTWLNTLAAPGDLLRIPGDPAAELEVLVQAINGTLDYGDGHAYPGTLGCPELVAFIDPADDEEMILECRDGGRWGNLVIVEDTGATFDWAGSTASEPMTGGDGQRGLTVAFDHADLRNALAPTGHSRLVHYDIIGIKADGDPVKLRAGHATLYRSCTVTA